MERKEEVRRIGEGERDDTRIEEEETGRKRRQRNEEKGERRKSKCLRNVESDGDKNKGAPHPSGRPLLPVAICRRQQRGSHACHDPMSKIGLS